MWDRGASTSREFVRPSAMTFVARSEPPLAALAETVKAEAEFDFRMPLVGGVAPPPVEDNEILTAEQLIQGHGGDEGEDDDGDPPLEGTRSIEAEYG